MQAKMLKKSVKISSLMHSENSFSCANSSFFFHSSSCENSSFSFHSFSCANSSFFFHFAYHNSKNVLNMDCLITHQLHASQLQSPNSSLFRLDNCPVLIQV